MQFAKIKFNKIIEQRELVSFEEFCVRAGYNPPEDFQVQVYEFIRDGNGPRMFMGARGFGKSVNGTILGSAYILYCDPTMTIAIVTKESGRSHEIVRAIAAALESNDVILAENNTERIELAEKPKGENQSSLKGLALGGRGFRGLHPRLIILDDPVTELDAWSEAERTRVKTKWDEILKLNQNVAVIGQPVSNKDLYSVLWDVIPTTKVTWNDIPDKFFGTIYKPDLEKMRLTVSERTIQMSYFLNVPDDPSLAYAKIETTDYRSGDNIMFIDPSAGKGDFTGISIGNVFMGQGKFVTIGFMFQEAWFDLLPDIQNLIHKFGVRRLYVECNGVGASAVEMLASVGIPATEVTTTQNKHQKIISFADQVPNMGLYKIRETDKLDGRYLEANERFIENVRNYTYDAKHDDGIDSMISLLQNGFGYRQVETKR